MPRSVLITWGALALPPACAAGATLARRCCGRTRPRARGWPEATARGSAGVAMRPETQSGGRTDHLLPRYAIGLLHPRPHEFDVALRANDVRDVLLSEAVIGDDDRVPGFAMLGRKRANTLEQTATLGEDALHSLTRRRVNAPNHGRRPEQAFCKGPSLFPIWLPLSICDQNKLE
jgi:hypothetical protein